MKKVLVVESPTKVKTISKFLGDDFEVISTVGHFRDLPKSKLGVDIDNSFEPDYSIIEGREKVVKDLKASAAKAEVVLLAPDPDREGEAIAWHVSEVLKSAKKAPPSIKRVVFNEITRKAVRDAIGSPREINATLVDAQQARRVLDRLVGYKISPVLWRKVRTGLSAGRVQSVAVKLICEREDEISAFKQEEYWSIECLFEVSREGGRFWAKLHKIASEDFKLESKGAVDEVLRELDGKKFVARKLAEKDFTRRAPPPFKTSLLQQEAARRFGWSGKKTMLVAQQLYEGVEVKGSTEGLITYMRTDSTRISSEGIASARAEIEKEFGREYLPEKPNVFKGKGKTQDAHEAIRPTVASRRPSSIKASLKPDQNKLYNLIWMRFIACQMAPARMKTLTVDVEDAVGKYLFRVSDTKTLFPGFLKLYDPRSIEERKESEESEEREHLPIPDGLKEGEVLATREFKPAQHFTKPPPRYNDASLVKTLEENGIGRPSTYAPIIDTIIQRGYVEREKRSFIPTEWGFSVSELMKVYFPKIVDVGFTSELEKKLDLVAEGKEDWRRLVGVFWDSLSKEIESALDDDRKFKPKPVETDYECEKCGAKMLIRQGKYGKFLGCSNFPECKNTLPLGEDGRPAEEGSPKAISIGESCPECGSDLVIRSSRWGTKFVACSGFPKCKFSREVQTKCPRCNSDLERQVMPNKRKMYVCVDEKGCGFKLWGYPLFERCDACGFFLAERRVKGRKELFKFCSNPDCLDHR